MVYTSMVGGNEIKHKIDQDVRFGEGSLRSN